MPNALARLLNLSAKEDDTPYYAALGKFIVAYALVEGVIHQLTRHLIGTKDAKARVLLSGARIGDVQTRLRGLLAISKVGIRTRNDIDACLKQFDLLGKQRDKLVHRFVDYRAGGFDISNVLTAKSLASVEQEVLTKTDLDDMELDCGKIFVRLTYVRSPKSRRQAGRSMRKFLHEPWRYKSPQQQDKQTASRRRIAQALLRQPQS